MTAHQGFEVTKLAEVLEDIIRELTRLETVPVAERSRDDNIPFPRMISTGSGGSLVVSRRLDEDIARVAQTLMDSDPTLKPRFTQSEWRALVRRSWTSAPRGRSRR